MWSLYLACSRNYKLKYSKWSMNWSRELRSLKNIFKDQNINKPKLTSYQNVKSRKPELPRRFLIFMTSGFGMRLGIISKSEHNVSEHNKHITTPSVDWYILWKMLLEDYFALFGAIIATLFAALLNTMIPLSLGKVVNIMTGIVNHNTNFDLFYEELKKNSLSLISLYLLQSACTLAHISILGVVGERLALKMRYNLFKSIIHQDVEFFDKQRTGELVDCLSNDVSEFKSSFKIFINQGLKSITQIAGCVASLIYISPLMTSAMLVLIPSVVFIGTLFGSMLRSISRKAHEQALKATNISEEIISNIRTVKAFANECKECELYLKEVQEASRLNMILGCGIGMFQGGTNLFLNLIVLGTLYIGSHLISGNKLSPGNLMSFLVATQTIQRSFAQLSLLFGHLVKGKIAGARILQFIQMHPVIQHNGGIQISKEYFVPTIEFKNVSFSYPTRPQQVILNHLNLNLPAGKMVAIVGASGNGKSTIVALLERFYDVSDGCILLGGIDLRKLDVMWLRQTAIGLISQEPTLFATSIRENIRYGKPDATDEEIVEAAKLANADTFIKHFPSGYDTVLGERGITISGGQKQRIALARVLLKNPPLLILDEATSALDPESESIVQKTLEEVCHGRTVLVIAHRLSTVQNADLIIVLNNGVVSEVGTHTSLTKKKGVYYNLMMQQKQDP